jgi:hypothetical protein
VEFIPSPTNCGEVASGGRHGRAPSAETTTARKGAGELGSAQSQVGGPPFSFLSVFFFLFINREGKDLFGQPNSVGKLGD